MKQKQILELSDKYQDLLIHYRFAFTDNPPIGTGPYLEYFAPKGSMAVLRPTLPYGFGLLDKYRAEIYGRNTIYVGNQQYLITIVQVSKDFHFFAFWMYNESLVDVVLSIELIARYSSDLPRWIEENKDWELRPAQTMGFNV